jgi:peptide/nickel transport system ATP-binding protein
MSIVNLFKTLRDVRISIIYITRSGDRLLKRPHHHHEDGRVVESGYARTLLATPQHPYSQQLKEAVLVPRFKQHALAPQAEEPT